MTTERSGEAVSGPWDAFPREAMEAMDPEGDFAKRHLMNPVLLRMLGDVRGRRVLDAGCGQGYFSRMLAGRGAEVVGIEPAYGMIEYAREKEARLRQGITYVRGDLTRPADLAGTVDASERFDAVVCSMVLSNIPGWKQAMRACVEALRPGGVFVFSVNHPAFEQLWGAWREYGEYRVRRYLEEYEITQPYGPNVHRPISAYLNELAALGCRLRELAEPGLDPEVAARAEPTTPGIESYVHLPNFLIAAAERDRG